MERTEMVKTDKLATVLFTIGFILITGAAATMDWHSLMKLVVALLGVLFICGANRSTR